MQSKASTVQQYISELPEDRKEAMEKIRKAILDHIPPGFTEEMGYGMIAYVIPHSTYPAGYHCDPKLPLPFVTFASQKNNISLYHMGIYGSPELLAWFQEAYPRHSKAKLDMGKSCIRFKKMDQIPYDLIGELMSKMTVEDWISMYEKNMKR